MMTRNSAIMEEKHGKTLVEIAKMAKKQLERVGYNGFDGEIDGKRVIIEIKDAINVAKMKDLHGKTPVRRA